MYAAIMFIHCMYVNLDYPRIVINGPTEADIGSNVTIQCDVLEGHPPPTVSITTPQEEVIKQSMIIFEATMKDSGNYTCVANNSIATVTTKLLLTVNVNVTTIRKL